MRKRRNLPSAVCPTCVNLDVVPKIVLKRITMDYLIYFVVACVFLLPTATGDCMYNGQRIRTDTLWQANDCTVCVCPALPAIQEVKCTALGECVRQNFQPDTTDGRSPDAMQSDQSPFNFHFLPTSNTAINNIPVVRETGITLNEKEKVTLTPIDFLLRGANLAERKILFKITEPLPDGQGKLERADRPGERVQTFTLDDLNAKRILFTAPSEKAIGTILDATGAVFSFGFQVIDERGQRGDTSPDQKFYIRVLSSNVDGPPSKVINITVFKGQSEPIPSDFFIVHDPDTDLRDLTYRMHLSPHEGRLVSFIEGIPTDVHEGIDEPRDQFVGKSYRYQHNGANLDPDWAEIQVSDGKHHGTLRINVNVLPVDDKAPLAGGTMNMELAEGTAKPVTEEIIKYKDNNASDEHVCFRLKQVPEDGLLYKGAPHDDIKQKLLPGMVFCQSDINNGFITYEAPKEIGQRPKQFFVVFDAYDPNENVLPDQSVTITVTPVNSEPPVVQVNGPLEVEEGGRKHIPPELITVNDPDTPVNELNFVIEQPPEFGVLENANKPGEKVTSFPVTEFNNGKIIYVSTPKENEEPTKDRFLFRVTDGPNSSPTNTFNIIIIDRNDEPPRVKTEIVYVRQGGSEDIKPNRTLHVTDLDTPPPQLIFTLSLPPDHGRIFIRDDPNKPPGEGKPILPGDQFSYEDVLKGLLSYTHDDTKTQEDRIPLTVTDGLHEVPATIEVRIEPTPRGNEPPRIRVNIGAQVAKGSNVLIDKNVLEATDIDSEIPKLKFTITEDVDHGRLILTGPNGEPVELRAGSPNNFFIQDDLDNGRLKYHHNYADPATVVKFIFDLSDPEGNILHNQQFQITVMEDRIPPEKLKNEGLTLPEFTHKPITNDELEYTDSNSSPDKLKFTVTRPTERGRLERVDQPGVQVTEFQQGDLNNGRILYNHTSDSGIYIDQFHFQVSDGTNPREDVFRITIIPVKDNAPVAKYTSLTVQQGERGTITVLELRGDGDVPPAQLIFDVTEPPRHGELKLLQDNGQDTATRSFTAQDIWRNRVIYEHDNGPATRDSFKFVLRDGVHNHFFVDENGQKRGPVYEPETFPIQIVPSRNVPPTLVRNLGLPYLAIIDETENKPVGPITADLLEVTDPDTPATELRWVIVQPPRHGQVENRDRPGRPITEFTQDDLNRGVIRYVLTNPNTPDTSDFFIARLQDNAQPPNVIDGIKFNIFWSWISFEQTEYTVQENAGTVRLALRKTGNLNQYSLVQCGTTPGTATDAPGGDFQRVEDQIQFEEGVNQKICTVTIRDDQVREGPEDFTVTLSKPLYALLREPKRARVIITDDEDTGGIQFDRPVFYTNERVRILQAPLVRTGDTSTAVSVVCITRPGTARDRQDFIPLTPVNRITFAPGQDRASCDVQIVDDGVQENEEEFTLHLQQPSGNANLGVQNQARVIIQGNDGGATVRFAQQHCLVREVSGRYQFEVIREGSDLSQPASVMCSTERLNPVSATPNEDYVHMSERVHFAPGHRRAMCSVQIIDDSYFEGNESFHLVLSQPQGATLGQPSKSTVTIFDTDSEVPTIQFERSEITVEETAGRLELPIVRTGTVDVESTVRCFTMSRSAQPSSDYQDRPNTDHSIVTFRRGERRQMCTVYIIEDNLYEADEQFYVVLGSPQHSRLGSQDKVVVTLTNKEDCPKVYLEQANYDVDEPQRAGSMSTVLLTILRSGDASRTSEVRVTTRDGTATAGRDYHSKSTMVVFQPGVTSKRFTVEILYDNEREVTETFTVHLGPDQPVNAEITQPSIATVCINDRPPEPMPILPAPPIVISLLYYENVQMGMNVPPPPGYPLMCLTPCNPQHPRPQATPSCQDRVSYRWEMATDTDREGNRIYSTIADNTPFTSAATPVLDSIYFAPNCILRCAVDQGGGQMAYSSEVTISREGACANPRTPETKGSQRSLSTDIQYNEPGSTQFSNTVHITVTIPHRDGILPVISTFPIHNPRALLTDQTYRQQHVCSNFMANQDGKIKGFLDSTDRNTVFPTQSGLLDSSIRGNLTVQLYTHLNMDTCTWKFEAYYDMTTLVDRCGGTVNTNANSRNSQFGQRAVTVTVPLYVTYIYAIPPNNWGSIDHRTTLEISFNYDTALSNDRIRTSNDNVDAKINVVRVRLTDAGNLCITIKTQTKFRGTFVLNHPRLPGVQSALLPPSSMPVRFTLALEWQQETYDYPMQTWQATSDLSLRDYTGDYTLEMIPCMATRPEFSIDHRNCDPRNAKPFILPIQFNQGNRPPPLVYSLNTDFQLSHGDQVFQADSSAIVETTPAMTAEEAFGKGETIRGCVMWNPVQDLKDAYKLEIQRLYVCCGKSGYTPVYDPRITLQGEPQYGCMQPSRNLRHRYLLLDRNDPSHVDRQVQGIDFQADFIDKQPQYKSLKKRSGIDGFVFKTDPLYELGPGRQWYLQVLYVITTADETRVRRSAILPAGNRNGTNMRHVELKSSDFSHLPSTPASQMSSLTTIIGASVGVLSLLLVAAAIAACVVVKKRRARTSSGWSGARSGGYRPGYQMQARGPPAARVRSVPRGGYVLAKGTEV